MNGGLDLDAAPHEGLSGSVAGNLEYDGIQSRHVGMWDNQKRGNVVQYSTVPWSEPSPEGGKRSN